MVHNGGTNPMKRPEEPEPEDTHTGAARALGVAATILNESINQFHGDTDSREGFTIPECRGWIDAMTSLMMALHIPVTEKAEIRAQLELLELRSTTISAAHQEEIVTPLSRMINLLRSSLERDTSSDKDAVDIVIEQIERAVGIARRPHEYTKYEQMTWMVHLRVCRIFLKELRLNLEDYRTVSTFLTELAASINTAPGELAHHPDQLKALKKMFRRVQRELRLYIS
jgi:hypothetical protein